MGKIGQDLQATIIMPVHNGATVLREVFNSLEKQNHKERVKEILLINDDSKDESQHILEEYQDKNSYKTRIIVHKKSLGLAASLNHGIKLSKTDYFILMQQDVILRDLDSLKKITEPFLTDKEVVATYAIMLHPYEVWKTYNFWQKCLFARFVNEEMPSDVKFNCIKKTNLLFDEKSYRTAEEHFDYRERLKKYGKIIQTDVRIVHLHSQNKNFSLIDWLKKESQWAEGYGVNLRKYPLTILKIYPKELLLSFLRPALLISLFINWHSLNRIGLLIFILFSFLYTKLVYLKCYQDPRVLVLPLIIFLILIFYSFYFLKGLILKKQTLGR